MKAAQYRHAAEEAVAKEAPVQPEGTLFSKIN
jgi:hypothetical protein